MTMPENRSVWFVSGGDRETGELIAGEGYWEHQLIDCAQHLTQDVRVSPDGYADRIGRMQIGDQIVLRYSIPSSQYSIGIYARGTVLEPPDDNLRVRINWEWKAAEGEELDCDFSNIRYGSGNRYDAGWCLWEVRRDNEPNKAFIRQAFGLGGNVGNNAPAAPGDQAGDSLQALARELYLPVSFLEEIKLLLEEKRQVIFQGPPGTGKTFVAQELSKFLAGSEDEDEDRVSLVQFHPSYAYEDFVQGIRPKLQDGQAGFELRDGPLLVAAKQAGQEPEVNHYLIIDEINRGNLAKVFGELYFLLEYRDKYMKLQYSNERFSLPKNLYIIGTMNTADRSIALVDLALRRRFYFVEFHPQKEPVDAVLREWLRQNAPGMEWVADRVDKANGLLEASDASDAAIGPSYFMKKGLDYADVELIWKHSIFPYVKELLFGNDDARLAEFTLEQLR